MLPLVGLKKKRNSLPTASIGQMAERMAERGIEGHIEGDNEVYCGLDKAEMWQTLLYW
jgi:hypothetical protein